MKKITLNVAQVPGFDNKALVKVVAQTSRGENFGSYDRRDGDSRKFTASNGITLASNKRPARDASDENVIWLRGSLISKDDKCFCISTKKLPKLIAAVNEYNRVMYLAPATKPAPAPKTASCPAAAASCVTVVG